MATPAETMLERIARELQVSQDELLREGLRVLLERRLQEVSAEILEITGRHDVSSVEDMEARYREGTIEESDSWRDLQRLDHLEYRRERLANLMQSVA